MARAQLDLMCKRVVDYGMNTTANHSSKINEATTIRVEWAESFLVEENTTMSLREFKGLLVELAEEHAAEMGADSSCYCKVKFYADDNPQSYRIDVNGSNHSISSAWAY